MLAANMGIALRADTSCTVLSAAGPGATARAACDFVFSNNLLYVSFCFLLKRKKAGTSEKKSRLPANITLSVPLLSAAPVPPAAKAAQSAPAHFGAAFLLHTRALHHPPAQTRKHF